MQARARRGFTIGTMLAIAVVCIAIAFVVAGLATFQLRAAATVGNSERALQLAEGAVAIAIERVHEGVKSSPPYGASNESYKWVPDPSESNVYGQYTFDNTSSHGYCTNNYDGHHGNGWNGAQVPQSGVLLVAQGVAGSTSRIVEALVTVPQFQYVLAVSGPLTCAGPLVAKAETSMTALAADPTLVNATQAANVGSDGTLTAGAGSYVTGDVVGDTTISLTAPSQVLGTVRQGFVTVPQVQVTAYDNSGVGTATLSGSLSGTQTVTTSTYASGPLTINGDLVLTNASLYVNGGPLVVNGGIKGTGAVFVNGNVQVNGGADLDAANMVALLTTGDVALNGAGAQSYFQGLVYTEGAFTASNITIAGAFVSSTSNEGTGSASSLSLGPGTTVVWIPGAANIALTPPSAPTSPSSYFYNWFGADGSWNPASPPGGTFYGICAGGGNNPPQNPYQTAMDAALAAYAAANPTYNSIASFAFQDNGYPMGCLNIPGPSPGMMMTVFCPSLEFNPSTGLFQVSPDTNLNGYVLENLAGGDQSNISQATFDAQLQADGYPSESQVQALLLGASQAAATALNQALQGQTSSAANTANLSLNQFLSDQDPVRIVMWREY